MQNIEGFIINFLAITLILFNFTSVSQAQCNRIKDSLSLVKFYHATNGENWHSKWDLSEPLEEWEGLQFNLDGCVKIIDLENNNLNGSLPNLSLSELTSLRLPKNKLSGPLLDFDSIPNMKNLILYDNQFSEGIPEFSNLLFLELLYLSDNLLSGPIPEFDNMFKLKVLSCANNKLSGRIPYLHNSSNLREFHCAKNLLTDTIPKLKNKPELYTFHCYENKLTGSIPNFKSLPKLKFFFCRDNELTGSIPNFEHFTTLEWFNCSNNNITGIIPADHSTHTNLANYIVDDNDIYGCYPDWICDLTFSSKGNDKLPWLGEHDLFCNNNNQIGAPCDDKIDGNGTDSIGEDCTCNEAVTSTNIVEIEKIFIFPNPNNGTFSFSNSIASNENNLLTIYNLKGQLIDKFKLSDIKIGEQYSINDLNNGIYFFKVSNGKEVLATEKIIIVN